MLIFRSNRGQNLFCTVSSILTEKANFSECTFIQRRLKGGFPLEFDIGAWRQKTRMMELPAGPEKFDDTISRFESIHECDGQTDRQTDRHQPTTITALTHNVAWYKPFVHAVTAAQALFCTQKSFLIAITARIELNLLGLHYT